MIKNDPNWTKLAPPQHSGNSTGPMEDLAQAVRDLGLPHLENAQTSLEWNGLTVAENYELFRTRDPMKLTSLVLKGLLAVVLK